jgi:N-acetylglucosamine-6-phosphate deacetylase
LVTSPEERLRTALVFFAEHARRSGAPGIAGVHLEGPFLSPARPGAHRPEHLRVPSLEWIGRLVEDFQDLIRIVTMAPELDGALPVIDWLAAHGIVVAVGHTDATYAQATAAFERGARLATHLFNAMRPYHHREPGVVGAALATPQVICSIIADLVHLHPAAIQLVTARKGPDRVALITDAIAAAGAPTRGATLGGQALRVVSGAPRLADGTLAGSVLSMDRAVRNMVSTGHRLDHAIRMASTTPAALLGLAQGEVRAGLRADLVVLDGELAVAAVVAGGTVVHPPGPVAGPRTAR